MTLDLQSPGSYSTSRVGTDFLRHLSTTESEYAARLLNGYATAFSEVNDDLRRLMARIAAGEQGVSFDLQERRLKSLLRQYQTAIAEFEALARKNITEGRRAALRDAMSYTPDAVRQYMGRAPTGVALPGVLDDETWSRVNKQAHNAVTSMFASTDSPLRATLERIGVDTMYQVQTRLQAGILRGQNPLRIASAIANITGTVALGRARLIARTEFHRAYRQANRAQYDQSEVVKGWVWKANLDPGTCPICVTMGGTQHPTTEILDGHPGCRCVMVPLTKTWEELLGIQTGAWDQPLALNVPSGAGWLERQGPSGIMRVFGPTRGRDILDKMANGMPAHIAMRSWVGQAYSPLWGPMRILRPITGGTITPPPFPRTPPPPTRDDAISSQDVFGRHLDEHYGVAVSGNIPLTGTMSLVDRYAKDARAQMLEAFETMAKLVNLKAMTSLTRLEFKTDLGPHPLQRGGKVPAHYDQSSNVIRVAPEGLAVLGKRTGYGIYEGHDGFKALMQHEIAHAIHRSLSTALRMEWSAIVNGTGLASTRQITTALNRTIQLRAQAKRSIAKWTSDDVYDHYDATYIERRLADARELERRYTEQIETLKLAKKGLTANKDQYPSSYGAFNENEDFAESLWRYVNTPAYLQNTAPARFGFFQRTYGLYPGK